MSCTKISLECKECHHRFYTIIDGRGTVIGKIDTLTIADAPAFTACGDTLDLIDGYRTVYKIGDHDVIVNIIVCE
jgi:hypothetical protein